MEEIKGNEGTQPNVPAKKKKSLVKRILKWIGITACSLVALLLIFATLLVWIMTPERLTPLIEKYGSEFLIADVKLERAELTFWHSFPHLEVDLSNLDLVSRSLDGVPAEIKRELPAYSDSLLSIKSFHGGVNIPALLIGKIKLYDLTIDSPHINLVAVNDSVANYNIVPPSDKEKKDTTLTIPDITINRFLIKGGMPVRYISLADSLRFGVNLSVIDFDGEENPRYSIEIDGDASATIEPLLTLSKLPITINGGISWSHKEPLKLSLSDFVLNAGPIKTVTDSDMDFKDEIVVEALSTQLKPVRIVDAINLLPEEYKKLAQGFATDLSVGATLKLTQPYRPALTPIPTADVTLTLPEGYLKYDGYTLDKVAADIAMSINGKNPDASVVNVKRFIARGEGMGFELKGTVTDIESDPYIDGNFKGDVNFARLPQKLMSQVPVTLKGLLAGEFEFRLRQSYLTPTTFHRILLNGHATLTDLDATQTELGASLWSRRMDLKLGTSDSFVRNDFKSDSLLTASIKVDTLSVALPGMTLATSEMMLGMGAKNVAHPDPKAIVPLGGVFKLKRLTFQSEVDSTRIRLRNITARASLQRYEGHARVPLLRFSLDAGSMRYRDALTRINFKETAINAMCHLRLKPQMSRRTALAFDSIQARYPKLRPDSVYKLAQAAVAREYRNRHGKGTAQNTGRENIDYGLDSSTKQWIKWIDFNGHLTSKRARLFTPYFPVRNKLSDIDVSITPDSLTIKDTRYQMGQSDFLINGTVSNISRAVTTSRSPLRIDFTITSDTINVNEIAEAAFAGAAFADKISKGAQVSLGDTENDELMQKVIEQTAESSSAGPLIIPSNIDAKLRIRARNIIYSDLCLNDFKGDALVYDGALNLHRLSAATDIGSIALSALYTAPTRNDMSFAFGLDVKDLQLDKFLQLVPAVDTLMPLLQDVKGRINAEVAATSKIDSVMDIDIPSLNAAIKISGDSLVLLDAATFRTIAKWMLFKNKEHNMIDHMEVQLVVENSVLELFPFVFDMDRYRLGVMGSNDLSLNFDYHVSVLKSPIPFKFGINAKGNPDKMKIRLGRARFKENMVGERIALVDTTRINLINQIENVFRRGVSNARVNKLKLTKPDMSYRNISEESDTISGADSLLFIKEGLIPAPPKPDTTAVVIPDKTKKKKEKRKK